MYKEIILNPDRIKDRQSMSIYMKEIFPFEDMIVNNLDALADSLSEVTEDIDIILTPDCVERTCQSEYAMKLLFVLGKSTDDNPHLHIHFREEEREEDDAFIDM